MIFISIVTIYRPFQVLSAYLLFKWTGISKNRDFRLSCPFFHLSTLTTFLFSSNFFDVWITNFESIKNRCYNFSRLLKLFLSNDLKRSRKQRLAKRVQKNIGWEQLCEFDAKKTFHSRLKHIQLAIFSLTINIWRSVYMCWNSIAFLKLFLIYV